MDEKTPLRLPTRLNGASATPSPRKWPTFLLTVGALTWIFWTWHFAGIKSCQHEEQLLTYAGEKISWKPCGSVNDHDLECSDIDVPMDQFNSTNSGDRTFNIPLIRLRGKNATQNILLNPGGPSGSGIDFLYGFGGELNTIVGENFHLVSFDPRGVNSSTPLASCYPDEATRIQKRDSRDRDVMHDFPQRFAWTQNYVKACAENIGEHMAYVNTPQTAADMNSILDAVGQEQMAYWGFSYGTILGQTYASLFPERSWRVIIDGVANQYEWYESRILEMDYADTDKVVDGFFDECVKAGEDCALSSIGQSKDDIKEKVFSFLKELEKQPIASYLNSSTYGILDYTTMWINGVFRMTYQPKSWPKFAVVIANLLNGNETDALMSFGLADFVNVAGDSPDIVTLNDGISGVEHWVQDKDKFLQQMMQFYERYSFATSQHRTYTAKQKWAIHRTHNYVPRKGIKTAHPLLVLSTTYDPVCPLAAAKLARDTFEGSRLVELNAYGHCSLAMPSLCIAKHVRDFFEDGTLPDGEVKCEISGPYFGGDDKSRSLLERRSVSDDDAIIAAQSSLAENMQWQFRRW